MTEPLKVPDGKTLDVGRVITSTEYDKKTGRMRCSAWSRPLITGQGHCLCGARFR